MLTLTPFLQVSDRMTQQEKKYSSQNPLSPVKHIYMFSRVTYLSTSICRTTTGQHNQLKKCFMRET